MSSGSILIYFGKFVLLLLAYVPTIIMACRLPIAQ